MPFDREGERGGREFIGTGSRSEDGESSGSAAGSASLGTHASTTVFQYPDMPGDMLT